MRASSRYLDLGRRCLPRGRPQETLNRPRAPQAQPAPVPSRRAQLPQVTAELDRLLITRQTMDVASVVILLQRLGFGPAPPEPIRQGLGQQGSMHARAVHPVATPWVLVQPRVARQRPARPRWAASRAPKRSAAACRSQPKTARLTDSATQVTPSSLGKI